MTAPRPVCRGDVPLVDGQLVTHRHRDQFGPCPAGQVEPTATGDALAARSYPLWEQHTRWVGAGRIQFVDTVSVQMFVEDYDRRGERIAELEAQIAELTKTVADCGICRLGSRTIQINDDCPRHGDTDGEGP